MVKRDILLLFFDGFGIFVNKEEMFVIVVLWNVLLLVNLSGVLLWKLMKKFDEDLSFEVDRFCFISYLDEGMFIKFYF